MTEQRRVVWCLDGFVGQVARLQQLQFNTAAELGVLLPSGLEKAFKGELKKVEAGNGY